MICMGHANNTIFQRGRGELKRTRIFIGWGKSTWRVPTTRADSSILISSRFCLTNINISVRGPCLRTWTASSILISSSFCLTNINNLVRGPCMGHDPCLTTWTASSILICSGFRLKNIDNSGRGRCIGHGPYRFTLW